jgi:hypothetical protein
MKWSARLIPLVVFAGPASLFAAALLLFLMRGAFEHGPGVPTAGREEAWSAMWGALGLVVIGHLVSLVGSLVLVVLRVSRHRPLEGWLKLGLVYSGLVALPLLIWLLWS